MIHTNMPEEALENIEYHLERAQSSSDDRETSYHISTARQFIDVARSRMEVSYEDAAGAVVPEEQ